MRSARNSSARKLLKIGGLKIRCCADNFSFPHSKPGHVSLLDSLPVLPVYNRLSAHPRRRLFSHQSGLPFPDSWCKSTAHDRRRALWRSQSPGICGPRAARRRVKALAGSSAVALDLRLSIAEKIGRAVNWVFACGPMPRRRRARIFLALSFSLHIRGRPALATRLPELRVSISHARRRRTWFWAVAIPAPLRGPQPKSLRLGRRIVTEAQRYGIARRRHVQPIKQRAARNGPLLARTQL